MKRYVYIGLFGLLGLLVTTLLHAAIEIPLLVWMQTALEAGETPWLWTEWPLLHRLGGTMLWLGGIGGGVFLGKKFWRILYVEKRYGTPRW